MKLKLLNIQGISKQFGGVQALRNCTLTIHPGELVGLLGSNGAGKTTLFNLITGFLSPDSGTITFCNTPLLSLPPDSHHPPRHYPHLPTTPPHPPTHRPPKPPPRLQTPTRRTPPQPLPPPPTHRRQREKTSRSSHGYTPRHRPHHPTQHPRR